MGSLTLLKDFTNFIWKRKMWWLIPIVLLLLLVLLLIVFGQSSVLSPFVYSLF